MQDSSQINQVGNSAVTQNTKTYGKNGRISKNHNGSIAPSEIHNILHDLLTSKANIHYVQQTAKEYFKQNALNSTKIKEDNVARFMVLI